MTNLRNSWQRMWAGLGASGDGTATFAELLARYREPHRKYHTLGHLEECIGWFEAASHLAGRPAEVEAALWFHDGVYDLGQPGNEERSADWAHAALAAAGVPGDVAGRVAKLVLATKHTSVPASQDEQLLVDIDLSILGADEQRFAQYEAQIADEYSFVAEQSFRQKRRALLQAFLDRPFIYATAYFRSALEARARLNLAAAIAKLADPDDTHS
ncbi:MAG TPA: N-methyl-D-aspartate receptor NMDAR2C subunit [Ramlibacter sp.]|nr:N-methyl-D-aspartate receptor NMDAR2C subunit [Ramlibacter sp.]